MPKTGPSKWGLPGNAVLWPSSGSMFSNPLSLGKYLQHKSVCGSASTRNEKYHYINCPTVRAKHRRKGSNSKRGEKRKK